MNNYPFRTNSESYKENHVKQTRYMSMHNKELEDHICEIHGIYFKAGNKLMVLKGNHTKEQECNFFNVKFITRQLLKYHRMHIHNINMEGLYKIEANHTHYMDYNSDDHMDHHEPNENPSLHLVDTVKRHLNINMK